MEAPTTVLYVNHTAQVSGGERSLLEILRGMPDSIRPVVACPDGPLVEYLTPLGVARICIPGTDGSLKLHPGRTPIAMGQIARAAFAVRAAARRHEARVVHANSIRAGLIATMSTKLGGPPSVVHLRDRLPDGLASTVVLRVVGHANELIANSRYTAASLNRARVRRAPVVLGNPVDLDRFDATRIDRTSARAQLGVPGGSFVAVVLAQITPWKGQEEAIRAVAKVRAKHPDVRLLLVGAAKFVSKATRYDNLGYLARLRQLVADLGLQDHVIFAGERDDAPTVLKASDALLVPSWEEPFGRSVIEAMAMRVPVIATNVGGPCEIIDSGIDGVLLPPRDPQGWAAAIERMIAEPSWREQLSAEGWRRVQPYGIDSHVRALLKVYDAVGSSNLLAAETDRPPHPTLDPAGAG